MGRCFSFSADDMVDCTYRYDYFFIIPNSRLRIDVEGDQLSLTLIEQIVYPNVMMMDKYLSGIIALIDNHLEPQAAISEIEK